KGYANFEQSTLTAVVQARNTASKINLDSKDLTPENLAKFQQAQDQVSTSLRSFFNVVFEKYPDLKANQNFLELQAQIEGTENRIAVARQDFNNSVKDYNTKVASFPSNLTAKMFDFDAKAYFESDKGAEKAPEVKF
ncbi:MAG: LemA family protein, partial [Bacteroidota bacterium]